MRARKTSRERGCARPIRVFTVESLPALRPGSIALAKSKSFVTAARCTRFHIKLRKREISGDLAFPAGHGNPFHRRGDGCGP